MKVYFKIGFLTLLSRLFYITLAKVSSLIFTEFDKSTNLVTNNYFNFLLRWDAIYFYEITKVGYTKEHLTAFFPLFPFCIKYISNMFQTDLLITGIIFNNIVFICNTILLYKITLSKYNQEIANSTIMFFMLNPCSIIMTTLYTEPIYTFLFLLGFYFLEKKNYNIATILFSLTSLTRSNGILNCIFLLDINNIIISFIRIIHVILPFLLYQIYCYNVLNLKELILPYSYIQSKYWEHGFVKFYTYSKNIPNIIIGMPFIIFSLYSLLKLIKIKCNRQKHKFEYFLDKKNYNVIVLWVLLFVQTLLCIFFIHMQMFFRFVCYNPLFYWFLSCYYFENGRFFRLLMFGYIFYGIAYAILFGAYYPPA